MDLVARRHLAASLRVLIGVRRTSGEVEDFLALLWQWESGVISGLPTLSPPIDASRETGRHPV